MQRGIDMGKTEFKFDNSIEVAEFLKSVRDDPKYQDIHIRITDDKHSGVHDQRFSSFVFCMMSPVWKNRYERAKGSNTTDVVFDLSFSQVGLFDTILDLWYGESVMLDSAVMVFYMLVEIDKHQMSGKMVQGLMDHLKYHVDVQSCARYMVVPNTFTQLQNCMESFCLSHFNALLDYFNNEEIEVPGVWIAFVLRNKDFIESDNKDKTLNFLKKNSADITEYTGFELGLRWEVPEFHPRCFDFSMYYNVVNVKECEFAGEMDAGDKCNLISSDVFDVNSIILIGGRGDLFVFDTVGCKTNYRIRGDGRQMILVMTRMNEVYVVRNEGVSVYEESSGNFIGEKDFISVRYIVDGVLDCKDDVFVCVSDNSGYGLNSMLHIYDRRHGPRYTCSHSIHLGIAVIGIFIRSKFILLLGSRQLRRYSMDGVSIDEHTLDAGMKLKNFCFGGQSDLYFIQNKPKPVLCKINVESFLIEKFELNHGVHEESVGESGSVGEESVHHEDSYSETDSEEDFNDKVYVYKYGPMALSGSKLVISSRYRNKTNCHVFDLRTSSIVQNFMACLPHKVEKILPLPNGSVCFFYRGSTVRNRVHVLNNR